MRVENLLFFTTFAALAVGGAGCASTTLGVPSCPNPVLLGPVDRVGGHRAEDTRTIATVKGEVADNATASTSSRRVGNTRVTTTTSTRWSEQASALTANVLALTEGRGDRDVRVDTLKGGAWLYFFGGYGWASRWYAIDGRVVEAGHAK